MRYKLEYIDSYKCNATLIITADNLNHAKKLFDYLIGDEVITNYVLTLCLDEFILDF